jgi:EAL domain-containing protein (putative c-di-GMP-specific phosphodiesterase class I)/ActR/RegA family two-component response regulator
VKALVVDDEPFVLKLLGRQLENLGFEKVFLCERGHDALMLLESAAETVDLVCCDLQMPEMDGVELVRHLVRIGYVGSVVLVSGEDERILHAAEKLAKAHELHVLGALHKPVSYQRLRQLLDEKASCAASARRTVTRSYGPEELRRAIASGELENHYQPKVELASGRIAGVETLVRWRHPRDGLVFPGQFIATAEEHGMIDVLTRSVLTAALRQARLWQDVGLRLHLAVNVSMDNLAALEFPDFVAHEADAAGVAASSLVLEVTESRLMKNPLAALDILTRLRLKRIRLSIDDFGTGHSSLAQLRDIPFDELKVDHGFVHGACRDASLKAIVEASLGMARQLGMQTVAEGVEDQADWDFLHSAGCNLAQGYFVARPMPAADLPGWIARWEHRRRTREASAS